jgi:hypothetical protein
VRTKRHVPGGRPSANRSVGLAVIWASLALFLGVLALLSVRLAAGQDPSLRAWAASAAPPPRRVLVRRVIERKVIVHLPPDAPAKPSRSSHQLSAGSATPFATPVTRSS